MMKNKEHLTQEGLQQIVSLRALSNKGLSDKLKVAFPDIIPAQRPLIVNQVIKDPNWIAGFTSGDGNFMIQIQKSSTKAGHRVWLRFKISQHSRDLILLKSFIDYFGCGNAYISKNWILFKIISDKVITMKSPKMFGNIGFSIPIIHSSFKPKRPGLNFLTNSLNFYRFYSTTPNPIVPVKIYKNTDILKKAIIMENKSKSGIYLWRNNVNGNTYMGSIIDLGTRFRNYFNFNYISDPKNKMLISKALIKYGYSNFSLEILEYCDPQTCIKREQYFLDQFKPIYNLNKTAGSRLGSKHSIETLAKLKSLRLSQEARDHLSAWHKGKFFRRKHELRCQKLKQLVITQCLVRWSPKELENLQKK
uniref:GIY-YIG domain-containing protein n=1 Tax=Dactylella sp. TaxID=1814903 RepID=A0A482DT36_9PEZI|nr:hypothetical protein [Dactylella sp.]